MKVESKRRWVAPFRPSETFQTSTSVITFFIGWGIIILLLNLSLFTKQGYTPAIPAPIHFTGGSLLDASWTGVRFMGVLILFSMLPVKWPLALPVMWGISISVSSLAQLGMSFNDGGDIFFMRTLLVIGQLGVLYFATRLARSTQLGTKFVVSDHYSVRWGQAFLTSWRENWIGVVVTLAVYILALAALNPLEL
ncbi:hypothetical protein [Levilactobacillus koreensis]|uniref:Uncharacterized protein n=1 Tax=Levilactobacillus koreensis TaxID=637971 RepID=A0AAC9ERC0_9LACO|nr:hypothetical protein [Levilactobacillus koreensis]AKP64456.1 hypothetical protein ABN16_05215 [Levilactobacillus koreensis]